MHGCKETQFTEKDVPDLTGRVVIVTGGRKGLIIAFPVDN